MFTILITTYNRERLLPRALKSALEQTYRDFEVIVIDDASTDDTAKVMAEHAGKVTYLRNEKNSGISATRNKGIQAARGEYIVFLDDDDALELTYLQEVHQHFLSYQNKLDFAWTGKRVVRTLYGEKVSEHDYIWHSDSINKIAPYKFVTSWFNSNGFVIKKSALLEIGLYDETLIKEADTDLMLRLLAKDYHYAAVPKVLINIYMDPQVVSLTRTNRFSLRAQNLNVVIKKNLAFLEAHPPLWKHFYLKLVINYYRAGQAKLARPLVKEILLKKPWSPKLWKQILKFEVVERHTQTSVPAGKLFVIAAPSGAGKSSLVAALVKNSSNIVVSISYTTRPSRPSEQEGTHYYFVSREKFSHMIQQDAFLEYANVFSKVVDHYYGTPRAWVEAQLAAGKSVILEIDWQGAQQVWAKFPAAIGIFILPPSLQILEQRLRNRGEDDTTIIKQRMSVAQDEISHYRDYQYLIVNDDFNFALTELTAIIQGNRQPIDWQDPQLPSGVQALLDKLLA